MCYRATFKGKNWNKVLEQAQEFAKGRSALIDIDPVAWGWEATVYWTKR